MRNVASARTLPRQISAQSTPASSNKPLIVVENVSYQYSTHEFANVEEQRLALEAITLSIRQGEYIALLGHNGSGKSTFARLLNALYVPTEGQIHVAGLDTRMLAARKRIRELVGMIFSDPDNQIIATLVEDDVAWGMAARGWPRQQIRERVDAALTAVGLEHLRTRPPYELSGGQKQRLAIAGILALEPTCIVADEPTALLDPQARSEMVALLNDLCRQRGLTIVHTTHLLEEAALADRIIVLDAGHIVLSGTPAEIFSDLERLRSLRLIVPQVALLGERLRALGLAIPVDALTPDRLIAVLGNRKDREQMGRQKERSGEAVHN